MYVRMHIHIYIYTHLALIHLQKPPRRTQTRCALISNYRRTNSRKQNPTHPPSSSKRPNQPRPNPSSNDPIRSLATFLQKASSEADSRSRLGKPSIPLIRRRSICTYIHTYIHTHETTRPSTKSEPHAGDANGLFFSFVRSFFRSFFRSSSLPSFLSPDQI